MQKSFKAKSLKNLGMALLHFTIATCVYLALLILVVIHILLIRSKPKDWYSGGVKIENNDPKLLRFLYDKAQEMLIHYDRLNWEIGSILVGSNLVAMSFSLQQGLNPVLVLGLAVAGIMSQFMWLFWFFRHMALYNLRSDVLYKVEEELRIHHHRLPREVSAGCNKWLGLLSGHHSAVILAFGFSTIWWLMTLFI